MTEMSPVEAIFFAALEKPSAEERVAYLDEACGGDPDLRRRVERLLAAHTEVGSCLEPPPHLIRPEARPPVSDPCAPVTEAGVVLAGRYQLLEAIGEGGMGTVWMAQQTEPVKRLVAVKLTKAGMDSRHVLARFEAERQALALMDHANIARVLDGGTTGAGRPYFVMDLVKGVPITRYCDEHHLTPRQRLELFVPVCEAVQHAHQKGIIHRDLKPSNVLVALYDGKPVPKVIDFGVAKAIGQPLTEKTLVTGFGWIVGTLEYMSPEQAESNQLDIDTRSDIYALGVLLYELLTGSPPFTRKQLEKGGMAEMLRVIREEEPSKPSTKLSTAEGLPTLAANRGTEPTKLTRLVRGELDWIVLKALEKDRNRRYETANAFALDLQRYLADEPVHACPPSVGYRLRKFVRRYRGPVLAAVLVVLALVGGILGTTVGLVRARQAQQAEAERADGERRAKDTAEKRLAQVEKGIDVLDSIFADLDPRAEEKEGRPLRAILGDRLDRAAAELEGETVGDPLVVARLQDRLGQTYLSLGHAAKAEALLARARATREARLGAEHALTLSSTHNLARAYLHAGKTSQAINLFEQLRDVQVGTLGADHLDTLRTLTLLGWAYRQVGKVAEAVALLEQVRDVRMRVYGPDHPHTVDTLGNLAGAYIGARRTAEAVDLLKQVHDARVKRYGEDHPESLAALNNLALAYQAAGELRPALELLERTRDRVVPKLGEDHPQTLATLSLLAWLYGASGRTAEAIDLGERVRTKMVMHLGAYHPSTSGVLNNLALAYQAERKLDRALPLFQEAAAGVEKLGLAHAEADRIIRNLCHCLEQLERRDEAEAWRRKWLAAVKARDGS